VTPTAFLEELARRGCVLRLDSGRIRFRAPSGVVTPSVRAYVADRRAELLTILGAEAVTTVQVGENCRCFACGGSSFWRYSGQRRVCGRCHPPARAQEAEWL
jgi:hypothetical protein